MNKVVFVLSFTTLACGATTLYFRDQAAVERERADTLQAQVSQLQASQPQGPAMALQVEPSPAPVEIAPPLPVLKSAVALSNTAAPAKMATAGLVPTSTYPAPSDPARKLLEDPAYRAAMRTQQRIMMVERYPDLGAALHLQPDQEQRLLDLLADQQVRDMSQLPPFRSGGQQPDENTLREWHEQAQQQQRQNDAELTALLGNDGMQQWHDYQNTLGPRMQVRQLRYTLDASGDPLREDQVQSLISAFAAENQRRAAEYTTTVPALSLQRSSSPAERLAAYDQTLQQAEQTQRRLHDAVAPYLSNEQLAAFDAAQNRQLELQRANMQMIRAMETGKSQ